MPYAPLITSLAQALASSGVSHCSLLLAVSGGADSIALLRGCLELQTDLNLRLHVAHLDHCIRGDASAADAAWVQQTCAQLSIPATIGKIDIPARAAAAGTGLEEAARHARYEFLQDVAAQQGCTHIATAHTADDQAETILHHVLRGTGLAGLRGMQSLRQLKSGLWLVRPLLGIFRVEIEDYLATLGQDYRADATNEDDRMTRNRLRRQLLPALAADYNPLVRTALLRLGQQAAEAQQALEHVAGQLLDRALDQHDEHTCALRIDVLRDQPRHLLREMFAEWWRRSGWRRQGMGFDHWNQLVDVTLSGGAVTLPGHIDARRSGSHLILRRVSRR